MQNSTDGLNDNNSHNPPTPEQSPPLLPEPVKRCRRTRLFLPPVQACNGSIQERPASPASRPPLLINDKRVPWEDLGIEIQTALNFLCTPDSPNSPLGSLSNFSRTTARSHRVREDSTTYRAAIDEMLTLSQAESPLEQTHYMSDLFAIAARYRTQALANPATAAEPIGSVPGL